MCRRQGVPGRSNALNIAARLGLPGDVVDAARQRLGASQVGCECRSLPLQAPT